jgi:uncharacterized RDD family membrane protein YckC
MTKWFIKRGDAEVGPGTEEQMKSAFKKGAISLETLVRREDSQEWMTLKQSLLIPEQDSNPFVGSSVSGQNDARKVVSSSATSGDFFKKKPPYSGANQPPEYASLVERGVALFIDGFILMVVSIVTAKLGVLGFILNLMAGFLYFVFFQQEWGYTVGRKFMNIHVETLNGEKPQFRVFAIRYFMSMVSSIILGIGYMMIAFSGKNQTLHDKIAETVVVRDSKAR